MDERSTHRHYIAFVGFSVPCSTTKVLAAAIDGGALSVATKLKFTAEKSHSNPLAPSSLVQEPFPWIPFCLQRAVAASHDCCGSRTNDDSNEEVQVAQEGGDGCSSSKNELLWSGAHAPVSYGVGRYTNDLLITLRKTRRRRKKKSDVPPCSDVSVTATVVGVVSREVDFSTRRVDFFFRTEAPPRSDSALQLRRLRQETPSALLFPQFALAEMTALAQEGQQQQQLSGRTTRCFLPVSFTASRCMIPGEHFDRGGREKKVSSMFKVDTVPYRFFNNPYLRRMKSNNHYQNVGGKVVKQFSHVPLIMVESDKDLDYIARLNEFYSGGAEGLATKNENSIPKTWNQHRAQSQKFLKDVAWKFEIEMVDNLLDAHPIWPCDRLAQKVKEVSPRPEVIKGLLRCRTYVIVKGAYQRSRIRLGFNPTVVAEGEVPPFQYQRMCLTCRRNTSLGNLLNEIGRSPYLKQLLDSPIQEEEAGSGGMASPLAIPFPFGDAQSALFRRLVLDTRRYITFQIRDISDEEFWDIVTHSVAKLPSSQQKRSVGAKNRRDEESQQDQQKVYRYTPKCGWLTQEGITAAIHSLRETFFRWVRSQVVPRLQAAEAAAKKQRTATVGESQRQEQEETQASFFIEPPLAASNRGVEESDEGVEEGEEEEEEEWEEVEEFSDEE